MWLPLTRPLLGTWPITQACALTGNRTGKPLVCRPALNPLSHTSQGGKVGFGEVCRAFMRCLHWIPSAASAGRRHGTVTPILQTRKLRPGLSDLLRVPKEHSKPQPGTRGSLGHSEQAHSHDVSDSETRQADLMQAPCRINPWVLNAFSNDLFKSQSHNAPGFTKRQTRAQSNSSGGSVVETRCGGEAAVLPPGGAIMSVSVSCTVQTNLFLNP